jgi:hypothetical protein
VPVTAEITACDFNDLGVILLVASTFGKVQAGVNDDTHNASLK